MTPTNGAKSVADYIPLGRKCLRAGDWGFRPEDLFMPELLAAMYFAASYPLPRRRSFRPKTRPSQQLDPRLR